MWEHLKRNFFNIHTSSNDDELDFQQKFDLSISDIEEEKEEINSSSNSSDSGEGEQDSDQSSESDHDESDQNESEEEKQEVTNETNNMNIAAQYNPNLPEMYQKNKKRLKNVARGLKHKTIFRLVEQFEPKRSLKRYITSIIEKIGWIPCQSS